MCATHGAGWQALSRASFRPSSLLIVAEAVFKFGYLIIEGLWLTFSYFLV